MKQLFLCALLVLFARPDDRGFAAGCAAGLRPAGEGFSCQQDGGAKPRRTSGGEAAQPGPDAAAQSKPPAPPDPHADHAPVAGEELTPAAKYFSDVELLDQDGRKLKFYSDVLKGKTVVVNVLFTSCTNVCPPIGRNFERIQEAVGERLGKDVFLVSITVDPATDTPAKLKEYAAKFHARKGWSFLTGKKENVDWALYKLGQYVEEKTQHKTVIIIGNEATGLWKKAFGLAAADDLIKLVEEVMNDKGTAGAGSK